MRFSRTLAVMAIAAASLAAVPASADPGHGKGKARGNHHNKFSGHCPPGLAKKNPPCVPPGQARKSYDRYGSRIGDILRINDYVVIHDPRRLNLMPRDDWRYYREGNRAYQIDRDTKKILSIINLIDAFTN